MSAASWSRVRSRFVFARRDIRGADAPLASATKDGVLLRDDLDVSVWNPTSDVSNYKLVERDDFVIGLRSFQHGIAHSFVRGLVSPAYTVLRGRAMVYPDYYRYYFRSAVLVSDLSNLTQGIRQGQTIDAEAFANLEVPVPPLDEQRRIADFLDAETGRIDHLRAAYEKAADRISERSQTLIDALISSAGDCLPLKYFVRFREGPGIMASDFRDHGTPLIRISGLQAGRVTLRGANFLDPGLVKTRWSQFRLRLGDYVISGSATMGAVSVVANEDVVGAIPYTGLIILRPRERRVSMEYAAVALGSSTFAQQIDLLKAGATMQHFGPSHLSQISLPFPDLADQEKIAAAARDIRDQASRLRNSIDRQLAVLAERRQALITAAVTGQIDVTTARGVAV
jgi:type I restriction enzyme S subunit